MSKRKIIINIFLVCITIIIIVWLIIEVYKDNNIKDEKFENPYITQSIILTENILNEETNEVKQYPKVQIQEQYKGYMVCAKLEIPKIELETYILKKYSVEALNISVTKFWGVNPNEIGNFCIAGHNFPNRNMFHNLKNLEVEDRFFISDNNIGKIEYEIFDIYKVNPNDVRCLSQETGGKREVTLITCTNNSKERIIVKGKEI